MINYVSRLILIVAVAFFATVPAFSADLQKGWDAYDNGDYKTALRELQPLAEQGDEIAQYFLGVMYKNGYGVPQDYKEAVKWYTLSAKQGDVDAQNNLGFMYGKGLGVVQDYKEAVKLYRLAAEQGDAKAQNNLGTMYEAGHGVSQDYVRAHMWYNVSASNGNELVIQNRDNLAKLMSSVQIEKAQGLARACVAKDYKGC